MSIIALIFKNVSVTKWWGKCQYGEISMTCVVSHIMEQKIAGCINGWLAPCAGKCRRHSLCDKHAAATSTTFCLQTSLHSINNTKNISRFHASVQRQKKKKKKKPCMPAGRQCGVTGGVCCVAVVVSHQVSGCWEDGVLFVLLLFAPGHQVKFPHKITVFPALCSVHLHLPHIFWGG